MVARLPSAAASYRDCAYGYPTGLLDLPLEILTCICGVLSVKDRLVTELLALWAFTWGRWIACKTLKCVAKAVWPMPAYWVPFWTE